jgi:hypothetical protein
MSVLQLCVHEASKLRKMFPLLQGKSGGPYPFYTAKRAWEKMTAARRVSRHVILRAAVRRVEAPSIPRGCPCEYASPKTTHVQRPTRQPSFIGEWMAFSPRPPRPFVRDEPWQRIRESLSGRSRVPFFRIERNRRSRLYLFMPSIDSSVVISPMRSRIAPHAVRREARRTGGRGSER